MRGVGLFVALLIASGVASGAWCGSGEWKNTRVEYGTLGGTTGYWSLTGQAQAWPGSPDLTGQTNILVSADMYVSTGLPCPASGGRYGGTFAVVLPVDDYNMLISSTTIVTELQSFENYMMVGGLAITFLASFAWGWKIVQRGGSQ